MKTGTLLKEVKCRFSEKLPLSRTQRLKMLTYQDEDFLALKSNSHAVLSFIITKAARLYKCTMTKFDLT